MSTPTLTAPAPSRASELDDAAEAYEGIKQYSLSRIAAVWAAAALPMGILAWIVAPALKDDFTGDGNVPMAKALILVLTCGLVWQGVMVAARGFQEIAENGDRFLVLLNGRRYEGEPGSAEYKIYEFERYAMRVETAESRAPRAPTTGSRRARRRARGGGAGRSGSRRPAPRGAHGVVERAP